ncbi:MAG: hypothetical protein V7703_13270, partial [Hyphomicrobiales bacterium]
PLACFSGRNAYFVEQIIVSAHSALTDRMIKANRKFSELKKTEAMLCRFAACVSRPYDSVDA